MPQKATLYQMNSLAWPSNLNDSFNVGVPRGVEVRPCCRAAAAKMTVLNPLLPSIGHHAPFAAGAPLTKEDGMQGNPSVHSV